MPSLRALSASAILLASLVPAASAAQQSPAQTAQSFYDAVSAGRWGEAAALVEPESAARYQRFELNHMAFFRAHHNRVRALRVDTMSPERAERVLQSDPLIPRDVSAMQTPAYDTITVALFSGTRTIGEFRALPPARFLADALSGVNGALPSISSAHEPGGRGMLPTIVGQVIENDSTAYVLFRPPPVVPHAGPRPEGEGSVEILYLRREAGRWRLLLSAAITPPLTMAAAVDEVDFEGAPDEEPAP